MGFTVDVKADRMFPVKRLPFTRLPLFCRIASVVQVQFQRAGQVQARYDHEPLPFDQIPGPQGRYATAYKFYRLSDGFAKFYKIPEKLFKVYGPIFKEYVTETDKTPVVHVMEPADFETVCRAEGKYPIRTPLDFLVELRKRRGKPMDLVNL